MSITKLPDGRWFVDVEPIKGKRFRKRFKTKMEAQQFEATARQKCAENPSWSIKPKDRRKLSELAELWYELHGQTLANGKRCVAILRLIANDLGDPIAATLEPAKVARVRSLQVAKGSTPTIGWATSSPCTTSFGSWEPSTTRTPSDVCVR